MFSKYLTDANISDVIYMPKILFFCNIFDVFSFSRGFEVLGFGVLGFWELYKNENCVNNFSYGFHKCMLTLSIQKNWVYTTIRESWWLNWVEKQLLLVFGFLAHRFNDYINRRLESHTTLWSLVNYTCQILLLGRVFYISFTIIADFPLFVSILWALFCLSIFGLFEKIKRVFGSSTKIIVVSSSHLIFLI